MLSFQMAFLDLYLMMFLLELPPVFSDDYQ
uniref:Uncharacterized protein n=1 Tax=Anguilla anguilla TaxID=7936 RepID=A0A0E9VCS5_ANGAN